ncbi:class I SAM-dependent methyltransferase [Pelagicoccus sp. NFK12]|uniref:Class I SAM-dependent methyltransferase n=1 Tax=Pelagicoccus enzymogenes TaxID=2773457 RepID=A0A927III9_9BACT|nr:methyltransferase domain-containing protein [Pelagicoccus enzymogenes]MBD5780540.1 class I SAM-dependent methyltransferase [Pelagicoccus enzymogenes]
MHVIDKATREKGGIRILGWCFKPGQKVRQVYGEVSDKRVPLSGFAMPSEDVAQHYGRDAVNARFDLHLETDASCCILEFVFENGSISRVPIDTTGDRETTEALEHRIHDGIYFGKFRLNTTVPIESVHLLPDSDTIGEGSTAVPFVETNENGIRTLTVKVEVADSWDTQELSLLIKTTGAPTLLSSIANTVRSKDQSHQICARFFEWLHQSPSPLKVVELGSRARSGVVRKSQFGLQNEYVGFDIRKGPNVDVVGDIHELSKFFEPNSIDAIAALSVIEHVAMPWKAAIEINKVLKRGGKCMLHTHQAWPLHESPYDFWRFSTDTWRALFNKSTGFRILDAACGGEANIHPLIQTKRFDPMEEAIAYTSSSVLVEKISETKLSWEVDLDDIHEGQYPA